MTWILDLISMVMSSILGESIVARIEAATDRRLIAKNRVRCGFRAAEGRVLGIGTEWSGGVCELSPGHLRFEPSIGIVGSREIDVLEVRVAQPQPSPMVNLQSGNPVALIVTTASGELLWAVQRAMLDEVRERLRPT